VHGQQWQTTQHLQGSQKQVVQQILLGENFLSGDKRNDKLGDTLLISFESYDI
jgi:hypothetical protein